MSNQKIPCRLLWRSLITCIVGLAAWAHETTTFAQAGGGAPGAATATLEEIVAEGVRCGGEPKVEAGPPGQPGKTIAMVTDDLRNGGVLAASIGLREAAAAIGWTVKVFDIAGMVDNRDRMLKEALDSRPDALALMGGVTIEGLAKKGYAPYDLTPFVQRGITVVSWHANPWPGPIAGTPVKINVTSDPVLVARMAASKAILEAQGRASVVILTDAKIQMAMTKANAMADVIRACKGCELLDMVDIAVEDSISRMPGVTQTLLTKYGKKWTHVLAINDLYFDYMLPTLITSQVANNEVRLISGGDGSPSAFLRIAARSFQTATAADPLNLQGWQMVDELNRLFARQPSSGFVARPRLVTRENLACGGKDRLLYDPGNGYRDAYRRIWSGGTGPR